MGEGGAQTAQKNPWEQGAIIKGPRRKQHRGSCSFSFLSLKKAAIVQLTAESKEKSEYYIQVRDVFMSVNAFNFGYGCGGTIFLFYFLSSVGKGELSPVCWKANMPLSVVLKLQDIAGAAQKMAHSPFSGCVFDSWTVWPTLSCLCFSVDLLCKVQTKSWRRFFK